MVVVVVGKGVCRVTADEGWPFWTRSSGDRVHTRCVSGMVAIGRSVTGVLYVFGENSHCTGVHLRRPTIHAISMVVLFLFSSPQTHTHICDPTNNRRMSVKYALHPPVELIYFIVSTYVERQF